ncbi:MAG: protein phosphatase 2C domain-containing protein [Phycisphaeraceae bacterium]
MPVVLPNLRFAAHSDVGRVRLAHEDACHCDPRMSLFVVADGLGGRPSGEAASHIVALSLSHLIKRKLRHLKQLDEPTLKAILADIAIDLSQRLREQGNLHDALAGMGATLSALVIDMRNAFILHAGDSRAYLLREGKLEKLTTDHFRIGSRPPTSHETITNPGLVTVNQRLLTQFIGIRRPLVPEVIALPLNKGDRLLLCSDGLTDPVSDPVIEAILTGHDDLQDACKALVEEANRRGGPDNITTVLVEFEGLRTAEREELRIGARPTRRARATPGVAARFYAALLELQTDLSSLLAGAKECVKSDKMEAFAAIKQRLGAEVFDHYIEQRSADSPAHVFHRASVLMDNPWRRSYRAHQAALMPHLDTLVDQAVRLSPLLTGEETASILDTLWRDWRRVEDRYFSIVEEESFNPKDSIILTLIDHMHSSVRTMIGLMEFFPLFMREGETPGAVIPPDLLGDDLGEDSGPLSLEESGLG